MVSWVVVGTTKTCGTDGASADGEEAQNRDDTALNTSPLDDSLYEKV